ncbi:MAG: DUF885 family protein [Thermaerobacter sp.]|nr:DUF885 family protein [Thermaerobacter sp.]
MAEIEQEILRLYLSAFGVERQEAGQGFEGFGEGPMPEEIERLQQRLGEAPAARRALLSRLLWRAERRGAQRAVDPSVAAGEALGAMVLAELHGDAERAAVLQSVPAHLGAAISGAQGRPLRGVARSFAAQAASLAAGLLLARDANPERAEEGDPLALGFMACEHFVRGLDALGEAPLEQPMGAHPYADFLYAESGVPLLPKEVAEAAMTAMQAELREARRIARQIAPGEDLFEVVEGIGEDAPENEAELLDVYRAARDGVAAAVAGDFPAAQAALEISLAPAQLHGLLPLTAYLPPSQSDPAGTVLLSQALGPMQSAHARARTYLAMAHDGIPGSHLLFSAAKGDTLRRLLLSPFAAQGWALYAARYAAERLGSEKILLIAALDAAQRAARAFADAALHAGIAPRAQILAALSDALSLPEALAEAELHALSHQPGSGALPWWLAVDIGERVRRDVEGGSTARAAHEAILAGGALPPVQEASA